MSKQEGGAPLYVLVKDMPGLEAGALFEHREYDKNHPDRGNQSHGAMVLAWINGDCQQMWAGESFTLPGQLAENSEWFKRVIYSYAACNDHWHVNGSTFIKFEED
jgi:hypothetical protein